MPEASVHEDNFASAREHKVWGAGEIAAMQPEAVAERVSGLADCYLRASVFPAHLPHEP